MTDTPPTLAPGLSTLQRRIAFANPGLFHDEAARAYYLEIFEALCDELETIPGYGVAMTILAEQLAYLHAQHKADMAQDNHHARDNQQLVLRLTQVFDRLLKGRDERSADEAFKRQFMASVLNTIIDALEEAIPDRAQSQAVQQHLASKLRRSPAIEAVARS